MLLNTSVENVLNCVESITRHLALFRLFSYTHWDSVGSKVAHHF